MAIPRIISMDFSTAGRDDCYFRILTEQGVKYVTIQAGALDGESLMDMPLNFQNILPKLPYGESGWNYAYVSRNATSGQLEAALDEKVLPSVQTVWHPAKIDFLDLQRIKLLTLLAQECTRKEGSATAQPSQSDDCGQDTMMAKIARFPWEIQYIEAETRIYQLLQSSGIGPRFLGHVHEEDRIIGFLLEKVEGRHAGPADLVICQKALKRLHILRISHGDTNRYNFIIDSNGEAVLIDFEKAQVNSDEQVLDKEMDGPRAAFRRDWARWRLYCCGRVMVMFGLSSINR